MYRLMGEEICTYAGRPSEAWGSGSCMVDMERVIRFLSSTSLQGPSGTAASSSWEGSTALACPR